MTGGYVSYNRRFGNVCELTVRHNLSQMLYTFKMQLKILQFQLINYQILKSPDSSSRCIEFKIDATCFLVNQKEKKSKNNRA